MSTVAEIEALLGVLAFPAGDVRREIGTVALDIAATIDTGDVYTEGFTYEPRWFLEYVLWDLAFRPNDPPNRLHEIRLRHISKFWRMRQDYVAGNGGPSKAGTRQRSRRRQQEEHTHD